MRTGVACLLLGLAAFLGGCANEDEATAPATDSPVALATTASAPSHAPAAETPGRDHNPPQSLLDIYASLPLPDDAAVDQEPVSMGDDLTAVFWVKDAPEAVTSFYKLGLVKQGWALDSTDSVVTDKKDDGTQGTVVQLDFLKENERLIVTVAPNINYSPLGQTHVDLTIQPR